MKQYKFNHEVDSIPDAMGFSKEFDDICRERILFSAISTHFITKEFFDEEDDAPKNMNTITGILEKCLNSCKDENEQTYTLLIFRKVFDLATESIAKYNLFNGGDEKTKKRMKIMLELIELKALSEEEDDRDELITPKDLFRKIDAVKNNLYSFENYYKEINNAAE